MAETDNTQSAGTIPQAVGDPLGGGSELVPERFAFPAADGIPGEVVPGPFGRTVPLQNELPPLLGWAKPPGAMRIRSFTLSSFAAIYERLEVSRPTVFIPVSNTLAAGSAGFFFDYFPEVRPPEIGLAFGLPTSRGAFYCWTPGIWWAQLQGGAGGDRITYLEIPAEDRTIAELLMDPRQNIASTLSAQATDQNLIAATVTTVIEADEVLLQQRIEIRNTGANPARFAYYNATPAGNFGRELGAGEEMALEGTSLTCGRIRAFSTAGTTISLRRFRRVP